MTFQPSLSWWTSLGWPIPCRYIWANYNISLTWIRAIWGWFPLLTMIPVRSQWGRYNLPRYIYRSMGWNSSTYHRTGHQLVFLSLLIHGIWHDIHGNILWYTGVSENSVPLNPMVNDHYPYLMAIIGNIPYFQTNPYPNISPCSCGKWRDEAMNHWISRARTDQPIEVFYSLGLSHQDPRFVKCFANGVTFLVINP